MEIRKANLTDTKSLFKVISDCIIKTHSELYPPKDMQETLNNYTLEKIKKHIETNNYFVAETDKELVGCVLTVKNNMKSLYVSPNRMREGIGRALLVKAEQCVKSEGYNEINLWSSLMAHEFYKRNGYIDTGEVPNENGLILHYDMKKILN